MGWMPCLSLLARISSFGPPPGTGVDTTIYGTKQQVIVIPRSLEVERAVLN